MKETKNTRNAGRPAGSKNDSLLNPKLRRDHYNMRLPRYVIEWLQSQPESVGKIVTDALIEKYGIQAPEVQKKVKIDEKSGLTTVKVVRRKEKGVTECSVTP